MLVYAIRQKSTGFYLPANAKGRSRGRGFTWDVPVKCEHPVMPRLFSNWRSARNALTFWLGGPLERHTSGGHSLFSSEGDFDEWVEPVKPEVPRIKEDMEIVPFYLDPVRGVAEHVFLTSK